MEPIIDEIDPIEAEVHAIRMKLRDETKGMTREERWAYLDKKSEPTMKKFNIKVVSLPVRRRMHTPEDDAW